MNHISTTALALALFVAAPATATPVNNTIETANASTAGIDGGYVYGFIKREGGYTNIRTQPNGAVAMKIKDGTYVYYVPTSGSWYEVYNLNYNFLGYVHKSKLVRATTSSSSTSVVYRFGHIKREGGYTNIRTAPNGAVAMKIADGTYIYYVATSGSWYKVYNTNYNFLGYVHKTKIVAD